MHIDINMVWNFLWDNKDTVLAIIGAIVMYFWPNAPLNIRSILRKIGGNKVVLALIDDANLMHDAKTDDEKMHIVADEIIKQAAAKGKTVSETDALWIVQNAYKVYKGILKK